MRTRYVVSVALILSAVTLAACGGRKAEADKPKAAQADKPVPVEVAAVRTQPVQRTVDFVGTLEAYEEAVVASNLEAPVSRVFVDMGDRVEKGRTLVKLDDERYRINLDLAQASLNEALARLGVDDEKDLVVEDVSYVRKAKAELLDAEQNYNRMKELEQKGFISRSQLDESKARYDVARATYTSQLEYGRSLFATVKTKRAAVEMARKEMRDTEVRAPFAGSVSKRAADPGSFVKVGGELVRIVRVDPLRLRGNIPEVNAGDVRLGQTVTVRLSATPGREYSGRISRISPSSSAENRAFTVEVLINNGGGALKPGYFAEASIKTRMDEAAMVVPMNSIVSFAGISKVFVAEGGKAVERRVTPGIRAGDVIEVSGGLKPGDMVITAGMKRLYDGKPVSVRKQP